MVQDAIRFFGFHATPTFGNVKDGQEARTVSWSAVRQFDRDTRSGRGSKSNASWLRLSAKIDVINYNRWQRLVLLLPMPHLHCGEIHPSHIRRTIYTIARTRDDQRKVHV